MLESGDGFGSVPLTDVPEPLAGSFGELLARIEEDRAQVRKNLDEAQPYIEGIKSLNESRAEVLESKGRAIVEVSESSDGNLTFAETVRRAEAQLGLPLGCDDPEGYRARKRGRVALAQIGMKWARGKGPKILVPRGSGN
jgi:hypothetical protein